MEKEKTAAKFDEFWSVYPKRFGWSNPKAPAKKKFEKWVERGVDPDEIVAGAKAYAAQIVKSRTDARYVAMGVTWLNQERWRDYQPQPEVNATKAIADALVEAHW